MDFLRNTNIDFMKYRKFFIGFSFAIMAIGAVAVFFLGKLNMGIDFVGGTQLTLKFANEPNVSEIRDILGRAGLKESQIQRFGKPGENEILVRTPIVEGSEEGAASQILEALSRHYNQADAAADLNQIGTGSISQLLVAANPDGIAGEPEAIAAHYTAVAESVMAVRKGQAIFRTWEEVAAVPGLTAKALDGLKSSATIGKFSPLATENVGPQVGKELRQRGFLAVIGALLGMLVYIWIRFELRFAIGATMASLHDVLITLGLYAFMGYEFNLTTIAAFLTLIGYSVNDTVVTFDRVRENMKKHRGRNLLKVLNDSLNQMLSRTLLTGGTTIFASLMLYLFGGDVIKGFAFIMLVGIIVGTYSSIYIASPFALFWEEWFGGARKSKGDEKPAPRPSPSRAR
ncbi:MAG: Protein-export rane protein SecF [Acidobacteriota bacterium]|nr:Protein-export rane protein SecF [Acidobacteriota bacterium]